MNETEPDDKTSEIKDDLKSVGKRSNMPKSLFSTF